MFNLAGTAKLKAGDIKKIHVAVTVVVVALSGMFLAKLISASTMLLIDDSKKMFTSTPSYKRAIKKDPSDYSNFEIIVSRNLFNSLNEIPDDEMLGLNGGQAYRKTSLNVDLVGTIVINDPSRSVAAIELKDQQKIEPFMIGDSLLEKATIVSIARKKVIIRDVSSGELEYIGMKDDDDDGSKQDLVPASGVKQLAGNRVLISRDELNRSLANIGELLTQARAVPNMEDGVINGFKLFGIQPGSLYQKLGAQNGDVIKSVNGIDIKDPATAMNMFQQLQTMNRLDFVIERGGAPQNFMVEIK